MRDDLGGGIGVAQFGDVFCGEGLVHLAGPRPGNDLLGGLFGGVLGQILVGDHDDAVTLDPIDDVECIGRGAAHIGHGLNGRRGVHIRHNGHAGIHLAHGDNVVGGD